VKLGLPLNIWERRGIRLADAIRLREQGLVDRVEFRLPRSLRPLARAREDDLQQTREHLGLPVGLHSEVTTFSAHPGGSVRLQVGATLTTTIYLARELGAQVVTVHPSIALGERSGEMPGARWTDGERRLLSRAATGGRGQELFAELLTAVAGLAAEAGVAVAVENMRPRREGADLNGAEVLCGFVRTLSLPEVRLCLDLAKLIAEESDLLANVHVAGVGKRGRPAGLGFGDIDWAGAVRALVAAGYRGSVIYEGPRHDAQASLSALRRMIGEAMRGN
jgi:sugar phosphate isomerase/epimerase